MLVGLNRIFGEIASGTICKLAWTEIPAYFNGHQLPPNVLQTTPRLDASRCIDQFLAIIAVHRSPFTMVFGRKKSKKSGRSSSASSPPPRQEEEPPQQEIASSSGPVQENLRWNIDHVVADRICNFNGHSAEHSGYFLKTTFLDEVKQQQQQQQQREIFFYDSNTGNLLFVAPRGRSLNDFLQESRTLGWLSFRQEEVQWDAVRVLQDGQVLSVDGGTHLGHDLPDGRPRYCINIMSIAGSPEQI